MRVLVIGGSEDAVATLAQILRVRWQALDVVHSQEPDLGLELIAGTNPEIVFMCADSGVVLWPNFIQKARRTFPHTPLLLLGDDTSPTDRILALEMGADDCLQLNCVPMELVAKVNAWLRRIVSASSATQSQARMHLHPSQRVTLDDRSIDLSPHEYAILGHLASREGATVSADELVEAVWGVDDCGDSQLLRQAIHRLRQKLSDEPPEIIINRHGAGYMLAASCAVCTTK